MSERPLLGFLVLLFIFVPLEKLFARHPTRFFFRRHFWGDVLHFLLNKLLIQAGLALVIGALMLILHRLISPSFQAAVAAQRTWIQLIQAILIADLFGYLGHWLTHRVPWLWRFHAVHHSIREMDWLAAARLHPLDQVFTRALIIIPLFAMGFTKETFGGYLALSAFWALLIHANVRFHWRWLSYVLTTPELHHWHHSDDPEARDKNFAGQLPLLDLLFGTFYLPKDRRPSHYGIKEEVPAGYWRQLKYPLQKAP
jgi:sterol desaturase/sphingolipid hydroxylase (fatty acid hydroxylase superfamily)